MGIAVIHLFSSLHKPPIANLAMKDHGTMIQTCYSTVGGIAHICFKWFQITADAHPGVSCRVSRTGSRPEDPEAGPRGGTPTFWGSGQVGVDSIRPQGAPGQGPEGP